MANVCLREIFNLVFPGFQAPTRKNHAQNSRPSSSAFLSNVTLEPNIFSRRFSAYGEADHILETAKRSEFWSLGVSGSALIARNLFSLNFRQDVVRMWFGCGSDVARMWLGRVFRCGRKSLAEVKGKRFPAALIDLENVKF